LRQETLNEIRQETGINDLETDNDKDYEASHVRMS
jgi:hypothetical protein